MKPPFSARFFAGFESMMNDVRKHIVGTSDPDYHYVANGAQTIDTWDSRGSLSTTALDTATKYLDRYGKKGGKNPKDLLKAIHYILMVYQKDIVESADVQVKVNKDDIKPKND